MGIFEFLLLSTWLENFGLKIVPTPKIAAALIRVSLLITDRFFDSSRQELFGSDRFSNTVFRIGSDRLGPLFEQPWFGYSLEKQGIDEFGFRTIGHISEAGLPLYYSL